MLHCVIQWELHWIRQVHKYRSRFFYWFFYHFSVGNVYIADTNNYRIRKLTKSSGNIISTIAGSSTSGDGGDGGAATSAYLTRPCDVAVDSSGKYIVHSVTSIYSL